MAFTAEHQPEKRRGPSRMATRTEVVDAWARLRSAASSGDVQASALLIALSENKPVISLETGLATE